MKETTSDNNSKTLVTFDNENTVTCKWCTGLTDEEQKILPEFEATIKYLLDNTEAHSNSNRYNRDNIIITKNNDQDWTAETQLNYNTHSGHSVSILSDNEPDLITIAIYTLRKLTNTDIEFKLATEELTKRLETLEKLEKERLENLNKQNKTLKKSL